MGMWIGVAIGVALAALMAVSGAYPIPEGLPFIEKAGRFIGAALLYAVVGGWIGHNLSKKKK